MTSVDARPAIKNSRRVFRPDEGVTRSSDQCAFNGAEGTVARGIRCDAARLDSFVGGKPIGIEQKRHIASTTCEDREAGEKAARHDDCRILVADRPADLKTA